MDYQKLAIIGLVALAVISTAVAGAALAGVIGPSADTAAPSNDSGHDHSNHEHNEQTPTETQTAVNDSEIPENVQESYDGAKALKMNLSESDKFNNASVQINKNGEVIVAYTSQADSGPAVKDEMTEIAQRYATVVGEHNSTGGLTVSANGVILMVSSDAAEAHDDGKLNDDAFEQTFHWETNEHHGDE